MSRSIAEPVIKAGHKKTKKTTTTASLFGVKLSTLSNASASSLLSEVGMSSGSSSTTQNVSSALSQLDLGKRIR